MLGFDACQFGICFKWNRWKWIGPRKTLWTKNLNMTRNCNVLDRVVVAPETADLGDVQHCGQQGKEDRRRNNDVTLWTSIRIQSDGSCWSAQVLNPETTEQATDILTNRKIYDWAVAQQLRSGFGDHMCVVVCDRAASRLPSSHLISLERLLLLRRSAISLWCQRTDSINEAVIHAKTVEHLCVSPRRMNFRGRN
jgi:hypothetical protein